MAKCNHSICLNMIVKDESHIISKTLNNICDHFPFTYYVICDTGSHDNTVDIITNIMRKRQIKGEIFHHPWKNFEYNRNLALEAARHKAEYAFIFDADDFIHGDIGSVQLPSCLTAQAYTFHFISDNCSYVRPLLVKLEEPWAFEGVVHECLSHPNNPTMIEIQGSYNVESGRSGNRNKDPNKYRNDAELLETAIKDTNTKKDLLPRYAFYCGQSWMDHKEYEKGIYWYKKCIFQFNNWSEEKYYSCLRIGQCLTILKKETEAIYYFLLACEFNNKRLECVVEAAKLYFKDKKYLSGYRILMPYLNDALKVNDVLPNTLFSPQITYKFDTLLQLAISSYYVSDFETMSICVLELYKRCAYEYNQILAGVILQGSEFYFDNLIIKNNHEAVKLFQNIKIVLNKHINTTTVEHVYHISQKFDVKLTKLLSDSYILINNPVDFPKQMDNMPNVVATMTTCKRLDLFRKTMDSIINSYDDFLMIDKWFVVDDNSSDEDINTMKTLYPFLNIIRKEQNQRGHRSSMNMIYDFVVQSGATYWLHLEDDWLFLKQGNYVKPAIQCLNHYVSKNLNIKQVLFNKGYGETTGDIITPIGSPFLPKENMTYLLHVQNQPINLPSSSYWAHYSFRPSLTLISTIKFLGNFVSPNSFFEGDYAKRFCEQGFRSCYLNDITCLHIGKLSGIRGEKSQEKNAYNLNKVNQFSYEHVNSNEMLMPNSTLGHIDPNITLDFNCASINQNIQTDLQSILPSNTFYEESEDGYFIFIEGLDIIGNDAEYVKEPTKELLIHHALQTNHCLAFNTLGFTKHTLSFLTKSAYFKPGDGLFIKKSSLKNY